MSFYNLLGHNGRLNRRFTDQLSKRSAFPSTRRRALTICKPIILFSIFTLFAFSGIAHAAGGIFLDDLSITNNGSTVLSDTFDSGSLNGWNNLDWASDSSTYSHSGSDSLYLDWIGPVVSEAWHNISITQPRLVNYSSWVYLPPISEQYDWNHNTIAFTDLVLYSGSNGDNICVGIEEHPGESGYRVWMNWNNPGNKSTNATTGVILSANTWALLSLQMDKSTGLASALLNGQSLLSFNYDATHFQSFTDASVWGWLGEGPVSTPEPSSFNGLLTGLVGLTAYASKRRIH